MTRTPESVAVQWLDEIDEMVSLNLLAELRGERAALFGKELLHLLADRLPPLPDPDTVDWSTWEYPELPLVLPCGREVVIWLGIDSYSEPAAWAVVNIVDAPVKEAAP